MLQKKKRLAIPIMTHPGIELCGSSVLKAVTDGQAHADAICALNDRFPADAVTAIMDLTVEAEAFGAQIRFSENEIPSIVGRLVQDAGSVAGLEVPSLDKGRIPEYLKANRIVASRIKDKKVFGGCIGPFSLAGRLFDLSELMMAMYIEPETVTMLLEKCTAFITSYLLAMKGTGIDGVILAEPASGLVSNDDCYRYSSVYVRRIVDAVQDDGFSIVLHNCGNTGHCTDAMIRSGASALHFGNRADMVEALKTCPPDLPVMGNIDPVTVMQQASPEQVYAAVSELLGKTAGFGNFILSTGCDVPPRTPVVNIQAFYQALADYNEKD
jgi:uroporphyrinogen decarboxylase